MIPVIFSSVNGHSGLVMNSRGIRNGIQSVVMIMVMLFVAILSAEIVWANSTTDPVFSIKIYDDHFRSQLSGGKMVGGTLLTWSTDCKPKEEVHITVYLGMDGSGWEAISSDIEDAGSFFIDPIEMGIPNGNGCRLRILATTNSGSFTDAMTEDKFSIDVDRDLTIIVRKLNESETITGPLMVEWEIKGEYQEPIDIDIHVLAGSSEMVMPATIDKECDHACIHTDSLEDDTEYHLRIVAKDANGNISEFNDIYFTVSNYVPVEPGLKGIEEGDIIWQPLTIGYAPHQNPSVWDLFKTDIFFHKRGSEHRIYLMKDYNQSVEVDLEPSRFDQGTYSMVQLSRGNANGYQFVDIVNFTICDGTTLILDDVTSPTGVVDDSIEIIYRSRINGPSGPSVIRLNISYLDDDGSWVSLGDDIENTGRATVTTDDVPQGLRTFKLRAYNTNAPGLFTEEIIRDVNVYHNDPPTLTLRSIPAKGGNLTGAVVLSWYASDRNGDDVTVDISYRRNQGEWIHISDVPGTGLGTYIWNISDLGGGSYDIRFIAREDTPEMLYSIKVPPTFNITGSGSDLDLGSSRGGDHSMLGRSSHVIVIMIVALLIAAVIVSMLLIVRRKRVDTSDLPPMGSSTEAFLKDLSVQRVIQNNALPAYGDSSASNPAMDDVRNSAPEEGSIGDIIDILGGCSDDEITFSDLYSYMILGLPMNASDEQIRRAYIGYTRKFHPDRFCHISEELRKKAEEEMARKNRAREILLDRGKRAILDRMIRENETRMIREMTIYGHELQTDSGLH